MTVNSYIKCSKCTALIKQPPKRRNGRCDVCWIKCLEDSIKYVCGRVIDNAPQQKEIDHHHMTFWEWRYAISSKHCEQLLSMVGDKQS